MDKLILKTVFIPYVSLFLVLPVEASDISSVYGQTTKLTSGYE